MAQGSHRHAQRLAQKTLTRLLYVFFERWRFSAAGLTDAQQLFTTSVKMLHLLGPQLHLSPASPGPCTTALLLPFTKPLYSAEVEVGHEFIPYLPRPSLPTLTLYTHARLPVRCHSRASLLVCLSSLLTALTRSCALKGTARDSTVTLPTKDF